MGVGRPASRSRTFGSKDQTAALELPPITRIRPASTIAAAWEMWTGSRPTTVVRPVVVSNRWISSRSPLDVTPPKTKIDAPDAATAA